MMESIGYDDPTHFAERIERRAHIVSGCTRTMHPEGIARESDDRSSRALANAAEPNRLFGDPDGVWHDDFENDGTCHRLTLLAEAGCLDGVARDLGQAPVLTKSDIEAR